VVPSAVAGTGVCGKALCSSIQVMPVHVADGTGPMLAEAAALADGEDIGEAVADGSAEVVAPAEVVGNVATVHAPARAAMTSPTPKPRSRPSVERSRDATVSIRCLQLGRHSPGLRQCDASRRAGKLLCDISGVALVTRTPLGESPLVT
jgi:hypothetical protein